MTESGQTLAGRYRIESVLGQGGMGAVYLASMEALGGKKVAIKEMELRGFNQRELEAAVKQFQSEARFLANLDHPNLVQVTDFFVEGDKHYLVMAYVAGQTLQQKLRTRGRPFPWGQVQEWTRPLCAVLTYLHSQNPPILFRDLKPSNIMVEDSGRLRLIDFGIARTGQEGERTSTFLQGTGTSGFSPLEQYGGGQSTDHRSDIYALGATLYQLLTGKVPPDAVSRVSQGTPVPAPSSLVPDLPRALDIILLTALAQNKADRQQTVAEFAAQLEGVVQGSETEDLRPASVFVADPGATLPSGLSPSSSGPNITVEMMPTGPTTTPLQMAAGLGAVAVVTLLLGFVLMARDPATASGTADASASPPAARDVAKEPASTPRASASRDSTPTHSTSAPKRRVADDELLPRTHLPQQSRPRIHEQPVQASASQPKPERTTQVKVVSAKIDPDSTVPTAKQPVQAARQEQPETQPQARLPQLPEDPGPSPVPQGMPTPTLKDENGRWLPPRYQPAGFPGSQQPPQGGGWRPGAPYPLPPHGGPQPGQQDDPTGYNTRRRH